MTTSSDDGGEDFFSSSPPQSSAPSTLAKAVADYATEQQKAEESSAPPRALFRGDDEDDDDDNDGDGETEDGAMATIEALPDQGNQANGKRSNGLDTDVKAKRLRLDRAESGDTMMQRNLSEDSSSSSSKDIGQWGKRLLGTFIVPAWSLSKGPNYIKQGDKVMIQRQKPKPLQAQPTKITKAGKKQTTLSFGAPASSVKKVKQKEDYIVRFSNMRGRQVGL